MLSAEATTPLSPKMDTVKSSSAHRPVKVFTPMRQTLWATVRITTGTVVCGITDTTVVLVTPLIRQRNLKAAPVSSTPNIWTSFPVVAFVWATLNVQVKAVAFVHPLPVSVTIPVPVPS